MSGVPSGLAQRLATVTAEFFEAKLRLNPQVRVLEEVGGDVILIKVEGFVSQGDAMLVEHLKDENILLLGEHHARVFEQLCPMLSVVVEEVTKRPLVDCRAAVDLSRDECVYLLRLGTKRENGCRMSETRGEREGDGGPGSDT